MVGFQDDNRVAMLLINPVPIISGKGTNKGPSGSPLPMWNQSTNLSHNLNI